MITLGAQNQNSLFTQKTWVCSFRFEQRDKSTRRQIRQIENLNNFLELSAARRVFQTALQWYI